MQNIASLAIVNLMAAARISATNTAAAVDIGDFTGNAKIILNSSVPEGAAQTSDVKLTHCATAGGTYTDTGISFAQVTTAGGASFQVLERNIDGLKQFVKVVSTLGGSSPVVTQSVSIVGKRANG